MDFQSATQDIYDLFHDINSLLLERSLKRLEEMLRPAAMSGLISDLLTANLESHSRGPSRAPRIRWRRRPFQSTRGPPLGQLTSLRRNE